MEVAFTIFIVIIIALLIRWIHISDEPPIPEIQGKRLLYVDTGHRRILRSRKYRIAAKPDYVYEISSDSCALVEFKNRKGRIYESDRKQTIASVIAAREKFPTINVAYIYTANGDYERLDVSRQSESLFKTIENEVNIARMIKNNIQPKYKPIRHKCRNCSVGYACDGAIA